jgi:hypothetical protein
LCIHDSLSIDHSNIVLGLTIWSNSWNGLATGGDVLLAHQNNMLVEYHASLCAPVGVVCLDTRNKRIRMIGADGDEVRSTSPPSLEL